MFLKVINKVNDRFPQPTIINTDNICKIFRRDLGYSVYLSNNDSGLGVYLDKEDAQKIFSAIGVSL